MHLVRNLSTNDTRQSYRVGMTIFDVWYHPQDDDEISDHAGIYIETIIPPEYSFDDDMIYYDGEERLATDSVDRIDIPIASWEAFVANPESYLMEALL